MNSQNYPRVINNDPEMHVIVELLKKVQIKF